MFLGTHWKANFTKEQFITLPISWVGYNKTLRYFEGSLELENKFEVIPIIVTICKKNHRLLGSYVLNINYTKLFNGKNRKVKKNFKAILKLKENVTPSYYEARKLPVHLLSLIVVKLRDLIEQNLLEHVTPTGSKWASPTVALRKSDGDICIR